jgi:glyoxylase-like metal-dependent hydrolase (beta-lactamase superfamily II)
MRPLVISGDSTNHTVRVDWNRDQKYPAPEKLKYTEIFTRAFGAVTDEKSSQPMSGIRLAAQVREIVRSSPTLMLFALENPKNVMWAAYQKLGTQSLPALALTVGAYKFTVLLDPKTKLLAAVRTRDDDNTYGDVNYDVVFSDWKVVGGVQIAHTVSSKVNDVEVARMSYKEFSVNPALAADTFAVPDAVKAAAKPPAKDNVPYQWVLRRIFLTRFLDSDSVIFPAGGGLKLIELAPNVQHVQGGTANNLIIAMKDHLVVFDAPYGELQSRWVIDAAKAKYPGKPIRYMVLSHHHMDHSGGTRTFVAEGATIVVPAPNKAYFEKTLRMSHSVVPDAEQKVGRPVKIMEVKDTLTFKDDTMEVRLMNIPNPHVDGMIIGHIVARTSSMSPT